MALAALLSLLGVQTEAEGIELVQSSNAFLSDVRAATGTQEPASALRAVQSHAALTRQLETLTGKSGQEAINCVTQWKTQAEQAGQLATQVATLEAEKATAERDQYVAELSTSGKLPPSLHAWAKTQTKAQLEAWAKDAPDYTPGATSGAAPGEGGKGATAQTHAAGPTSQAHTAVSLDADDLETCKLLGIPPEQFLERKKFEAQNQSTPFAVNTTVRAGE